MIWLVTSQSIENVGQDHGPPEPTLGDVDPWTLFLWICAWLSKQCMAGRVWVLNNAWREQLEEAGGSGHAWRELFSLGHEL